MKQYYECYEAKEIKRKAIVNSILMTVGLTAGAIGCIIYGYYAGSYAQYMADTDRSEHFISLIINNGFMTREQVEELIKTLKNK